LFSVPVPSAVAPSRKVTVPVGVPDALDVTVAVNVMDSPKSGEVADDCTAVFVAGLLTVRLIVVVFNKMPDDPVMVTVTVPTAADALAVSDNVLVVVAGLGLNDAVTPVGRPEADRVTLPTKPFVGVTLIVVDPAVPPRVIVTEFGDAESEKLNPVGRL